MASHYEVLGVAPSASLEEIVSAYRVRARLLHPDHHATEPADVQSAARAQFDVVAEAYRVLSDPATRAAYDRAESAPSHSSQPDQPPASPGFDTRVHPGSYVTTDAPRCQVCGRSPASPVAFSSIKGRIIWLTYGKTSGVLCRDCGLAVGRDAQIATLNQGWWGVFSFFATPIILISNAGSLRSVSALGEPDGPGPHLDPGKAVLRRPLFGLLAAIVLFGAGLWAMGNDQRRTQPPTTAPAAAPSTLPKAPTTSASSFEPSGWAVGVCVGQVGTRAVPVPCSEPHIGQVVSMAFNPSQCRPPGDKYVESPSGAIWCVVPS